eukprot:m.179209 g.179209  ORF g.179209 m.179209 type:complete len:345 (+) comp18388_c0_seq1:656-1690(+)
MPRVAQRLSHESMLREYMEENFDDDSVCRNPGSVHRQVGLPDSSRRSRKPRRMSNSRGVQEPFFRAASCQKGTSPALYFEVKYYGPCAEIPTNSNKPAEINVVEIMQRKKESSQVVVCNLYFNEHGISVITKRGNHPVTLESWRTVNIAACATVKHPQRSGRRVGLLKVRDATTGAMTWHLFKYYCGRKDNMTDCFRFVVDCSLREIGRVVAARAKEDRRRMQELQQQAPQYEPPPVWAEPDAAPPPRYDAENRSQVRTPPRCNTTTRADPTSGYAELEHGPRRVLSFGRCNQSDAEAEAADIAQSLQRMRQRAMASACTDTFDNSNGYMLCSTTSVEYDTIEF